MSLHFFSMVQTALNAGFVRGGLLVAVIALACIVGAEIVGISILISKMLRARTRRKEDMDEEDKPSSQDGRYYAMMFLAGAVPQLPYVALGILSIVAAVGALAFLVLLVVFLACGYSLAPARWLKEQRAAEEEEAAVAEEKAQPRVTRFPAEDEPLEVFAELPVVEENAEEAEAPFEDEDELIEAPETVAIEEASEEETEISAESDEAVEETVAVEPVVLPSETVAPATVAQTTVTTATGPMFADGTQPYKVVEKVVTETVKEIVKETPIPTPVPTPTPQATDANGAIMEKLSDFLDYELQKRRTEEEGNGESEDKKEKKSVVAVDAEDVDDDDADLDEDTEDEEESAEEKDGDEERDDEENDTEGDHFTGNERIIGFDEETGCYIVAHYRKSFEAKLIQARPNIKKYYSDLKNALLAYKGTKDRISWNMDSFHNGRTPIAKINVKTRILELYLAIDPDSLEGTVYRGKNVGDKKKYAETPFRYKLRTPRKLQWALELVQRTCEEHGLSPIDIEPVNYDELYPFDTTENLVERKLIKEYIRQEKPATTFELAEDHVPTLPEEDGSVIPANANFSWEFDNEKLQETPEEVEVPEETVEEVVASETTPEPQPEPAEEIPPVAESVPAVQPSEPLVARETIRETVKVTEMRYTERLFADPNPTYERIVTTQQPLIEGVAVPAETKSVEEELEAKVNEVFGEVVADTTQEKAEESVSEISEEPIEEASVAAFAEDAVEGSEDAQETEEERTEPISIFDTVDPFAAYRDEADPVEEEVIEEEVEEAVDETLREVLDEAEEDEAIEESETEVPADEEETFLAEDEPSENLDEESAKESYGEDEAEEEATEEVGSAESVEEVVAESPYDRVNFDPEVALVDIAAVQNDFADGDTVNIATLSELGLIASDVTKLKIYTTGDLNKSLNVEANHLTLDAIKAISDAEGTIAITQ